MGGKGQSKYTPCTTDGSTSIFLQKAIIRHIVIEYGTDG